MKSFKKLLVAGSIAAGALASTSAQAGLILSFFDGNNVRMASWTTILPQDNVIKFEGFINGYQITATAGNLLSLNPLDMNINGTIQKVCQFGGTWDPPGPPVAQIPCSTSTIGSATTGSPIFSGGSLPNTPAPANTNGNPTPTAGTENDTLKIRLTLTDLPLTMGSLIVLDDALTFSSAPSLGRTSTSFVNVSPGSSINPPIPLPNAVTLGTINFDGVTNNLGTESTIGITNDTDADNLINLTFGFDIFANSPQSGNDQFSFTNSIRTTVPEPGSLALLGLGLLGVAAYRRRKTTA